MPELLQVQNLTVKRKSLTICEQLTFSVKAGEIWGILGPNASGKTTLLHALTGLSSIQTGTVYVLGKILSGLSRKVAAKQIGLLFQDFSANFHQTVLDYCLSSRFPHLNYFQKITPEDELIVFNALKVVELESLLKRSIFELSGGEKKRLAIAALLIQTPELYLLDEPLNHLDLRHQMQLIQHLQKLAIKGKGVIIALHDINMAAAICDYVLLIFSDGKIIHGKTDELLTESNLSALYKCPIVKRYDQVFFTVQ